MTVSRRSLFQGHTHWRYQAEEAGALGLFCQFTKFRACLRRQTTVGRIRQQYSAPRNQISEWHRFVSHIFRQRGRMPTCFVGAPCSHCCLNRVAAKKQVIVAKRRSFKECLAFSQPLVALCGVAREGGANAKRHGTPVRQGVLAAQVNPLTRHFNGALGATGGSFELSAKEHILALKTPSAKLGHNLPRGRDMRQPLLRPIGLYCNKDKAVQRDKFGALVLGLTSHRPRGFRHSAHGLQPQHVTLRDRGHRTVGNFD